MTDSPAVPVFSVGLRSEPESLVPFVRRAEQLGFFAAWTQDTMSPRNFALDGLHQLSYVAAVTERMRLGISVLYSGHRNPAVLARELATIDQLSRGRLTVGIGVGNAYHRERLTALGIPVDRPVRRLIEGIGVMRALWAQDKAGYNGELYSFSGIQSQPKPVQQPGPPIWLGARAEPALRRAVAIADGWTGAAPVSTSDFLSQLDIVKKALDDQGRDPASFAISKGVYIIVHDDRQRARELLAPIFDRGFGANPVYDARGMADRVAVFGPAEYCAEQLTLLLEAGTDELVLHPMYEPIEQLEALAGVTRLLAGASAAAPRRITARGLPPG